MKMLHTSPARVKSLMLLLGMVLVAAPAYAQGTEAALGSFFLFLLLLLTVLLVALVLLVTFVITRRLVFAVPSLIIGVILFLAGTLISVALGNSNLDEVRWISGTLTTSGLLNLLIVLGIMLFFPLKGSNAAAAPESLEGAGDRSATLTVKWLTLVVLFWLLHEIGGAVSYWSEMNQYDAAGDYLLPLLIIQVLVLASALVLLSMKKRAGWYLLFIFLVYMVASMTVFMIRMTLFKHDISMPGNFIVTNLVIVAVFTVCMALFAQARVRRLYAVSQAGMLIAALAGVVVAAAIQLANAQAL